MNADASPADSPVTIYDVAHHLSETASFDRAAAVPGLFVAWCANLGLLSEDVERAGGDALVRLRMRDMRGGEFLVATLGGAITEAHLSRVGFAFARKHYAAYLQELPDIVGVADLGGVRDSWAHYDLAAPWLTRRHLGPARRSGGGSGLGKLGQATDKKWWQVWKPQ